MEFPIEIETGATILGVESPEWANQEKTAINCIIEIEGGSFFTETTKVPFCAVPTDPMSHGRELFEFLKVSAAPYDRPLPTKQDLQDDFDAIWPDVLLGLADEKTIDLAKNLRVQIKAMS